jgi:phage-related protein (TIGR01555 family)
MTNTVLIDSKEKFERITTPMSGLPEMLDRFCNRLAAATKTPVTLLMGQAPAGLNATGKADMQFFADQVRAEQKKKMRRQLTRIIKLLFLAKNGPTKGVAPEKWSIKFNPLTQLSPLEEATMRYTVAQTDGIYIDKQVTLAEEVAKSRFGGDGYSMETKVNLKLRAKMMANPHPEATLKDPTGEAADAKSAQEAEQNKAQLAAMARNPDAVGLASKKPAPDGE